MDATTDEFMENTRDLAIIGAYAMAIIENKREISNQPLSGLFMSGLMGSLYALGAGFVVEILPPPLQPMVPTFLAFWCARNLWKK